MTHYPPSILNLIKCIAKLPGIGEKTAERLALHILRSPRAEVEKLSNSIIAAKEKVRLCKKCFGLSDGEICQICSNPARDDTLLCVVEQPADMVAMEKSAAFNGLYHILSGVLSPMNGIGPEDIRLGELIAKIEHGRVKEVVLATSTTVEGEATAAYIKERLENYPLKVTRIASGVPIGGDLKYVDQVTLKKAMEKRHDM
ncbi:MAG: recombination protein RecR [Deltaproteobacteria bacterium]|jgi:recombination protein RecR|nr:recombination protein RecR [Deltaproteobacteria bacterium]MBW2470087.1 recombination protein RecR [Deltaproteobacteria bacterium]MBW2515414.1 recombination protein RecR [Deltaproteobacteria bacterium]